MIDISNLKDTLDPKLSSLIAQFRRVQVSKFPLIAGQPANDFVRFVDSRFESAKSWGRVGSVRVEYEEEQATFIITSHTIVNSRYKGPRKNEKHTKDAAKAVKYLQSYIRPFTPQYIAMDSMLILDHKFDSWKWGINKAADSVMRIGIHEVYEELKLMRELGLRPQTRAFQLAMETGIEKYEAMRKVSQRRADELVHVFFNPDESADVHMHKAFDGIATSYRSAEEMPYELASRISMLRMTEKEEFVPNVGMQINDRTFWVDLMD